MDYTIIRYEMQILFINAKMQKHYELFTRIPDDT